MSVHLGYGPGQAPPGGAGNARNGTTPKTLQTEHGAVRIEAPRDRGGTFEPQIVRKGQRRFEGFDDKIVAMYARGMTTRDIEAHLKEIYGALVGRDTVSQVTNAVLADAKALAEPPAGVRLPHRLSRRLGREDPRWPGGAQSSLLPGHRRQHRRPA